MKPCIQLSCQRGTSEEKKDRLTCCLWSVSLGRWAAVIWNSCKCDLNAAEFWLQFQSLSGFSLQSYIKARRCEAGKESMDNNECKNRGSNLSWQLLIYIMRYLVTCFQTSMQAVYKIYTEKIVVLLLMKILFCGWCLLSCVTLKGGSIHWHLNSWLMFSVLGWARRAVPAEFSSCCRVCWETLVTRILPHREGYLMLEEFLCFHLLMSMR